MSIQTNKLPDNPQIEVLKSGKTGLFTNYIYKAIPLAFDESMSYYETLCGLLHYLKNVVIPTVNNNADAVAELQSLYEQLRTYVNDYFKDLDVQEEINNKLDEMVEDGTLPEIIASYLNSKAIFGFDNVESMKNATNLIDGSYARTIGYYEKNDGGGALYKITNSQSSDDIQIELNNGLYATLIFYEKINLLTLGIQENEEISTIVNSLLNRNDIKTVIIPKGVYTITNTILVPSNKELKGQFENLGNTSTTSKIVTTSDIIMINASEHLQIVISDLILSHPDTNTNPIIKVSQTKYSKFKNLLITHESTNICEAKVITDTDTTGWSGYLTLDNVRASYYQNPLYFKATFIKIINCVLQHASTYAIWLTGEGIGGIEKTDISKSNEDNFISCVRYDGHYGVNIIDCYLENYFLEEVITNTNNVPVNITGCKIFERGSGTNTNGVMTFSNEKYPQNKRNIHNSFISGYASVNNLIANGDFNDTFNWNNINNTATIEYLNKEQMDTLTFGLPTYYKKCCHKSGLSGGIYQKIDGTYNIDDVLTIGFWLFLPTNNTTRGYIYITDAITGASHSVVELRPEKKYGEWCYYQASAKIKSNDANKQLYFKILYGDNQEFYITGLSICKGYNSTIDCNYTPNKDKIITDKFILKGSNNKYYNISYDGTNFTATEVSNFD